MSEARWSRDPRETGLRAVVQGERGFQLKKDGDVIVRVAPIKKGGSSWGEVIGWYWYGMGQNTCISPCDTADEAKAQAMAHYKSHGDQS